VQVYGRRPLAGFPGVERTLLGFARVDLDPGQRARARVEVPLRRLATRDGPGRWSVPPGDLAVEVGGYAGDPEAQVVAVRLGQRR
jgi:beta-glucosidase